MGNCVEAPLHDGKRSTTDYVKAIKNTKADCTWGQICSVSPVVKAGIAYGLITPNKPKSAKNNARKKNAEAAPSTVPATLPKQYTTSPSGIDIELTVSTNRPITRPVGISSRVNQKPHEAEEVLNVDQVIAEHREEIVNFHTNGVIKGSGKVLHKILVDGGSVVNLIPDFVARELGLKRCNGRARIRTATGDTFGINFYV